MEAHTEFTSVTKLKGDKVELMVSCTDLADLDQFTKSDPLCVLFIKQFGQWKEVARTEALINILNPKFVENFVLEYEPDIQQQLMFSVYDIDSRTTDLKCHDFVGSIEVLLSDLIDAFEPYTTTTRTLRVKGDPKPRGLISITAEIVRDSKNKVRVHAGGHKLDKKGLFALKKPSTYLEISRQIGDQKFHPVYRTERVLDSRNPRWKPFEIGVQKLCNDDWERKLEFSVWHHDGVEKYKMLGRYCTTLREMSLTKSSGHHYTQFDIVCPKRERKKKKKIKFGALRFYQFKSSMLVKSEARKMVLVLRSLEALFVEPEVKANRCPIQFIRLRPWRFESQINCCNRFHVMHRSFPEVLATKRLSELQNASNRQSSNGVVTDALSLHNITNLPTNHYMHVINTVAEAIIQYDIEQKIAVFGFGAKKSAKDFTSQCFPLSKSENNVYVNGLKGVEEVYRKAVEELHFSGPTELSHIIEKAMNMTREERCTQDNQSYSTLLIITDGIANDYDKTLERLVESSELPLSVIIVGLGPSEFSFMEHAEHSNLPVNLPHRKKSACRCNTQFIVMKKNSLSDSGHAAVARECMAALSKQIVQYLKDRQITPNKPLLKHSFRRKSKNKWVDSKSNTDERRPLGDSLRFSNIYNQSAKSVEGPVCPTCGSMLSLNDENIFL